MNLPDMDGNFLKGMDRAARMCPRCGSDSTVRRSEEQADGSILRRRVCKSCGMQFETVEIFLRPINIPDGA